MGVWTDGGSRGALVVVVVVVVLWEACPSLLRGKGAGPAMWSGGKGG